MKTRILVSLIAGFLCWSASAQTADDCVSQGRSYLAARDITDANASFAQALALDPNNEDANALYAVTRLLVLPSQPAGSNFLTRIGFPVAGRNIYSWSSTPPKDVNGLWLAPDGVNANEFTAQLRTNILPVVSGAVGNLAAITDTNFTISLTSSETAITAVTVDYGDLKLIQAGLYASEYLIYTLNAQNLDAQLTAIRALYTNGALSAGQVLSDYPQLLTFSTTNDLQAARAAFTNAVNCYMTASAFIRSRPPSEVRLFNYDKVSAQSESDFRSGLTDLENSLAGAQVLSVKTNLTVDMANSFTGIAAWRGLLPQFQNKSIVLGSFPDLTFGGVIGGLTRDEVEGYLGTRFVMLPVGYAPLPSPGGATLPFATLRGHYYALEASTNLVDWQVVASFTATNAVSSWVDSQALSKRFYRLRDDTGFLAFSGVVLNQNTGLPIAGAQVYSLWDGTMAYTDSNGQFYLSTSLPVYSWGADDYLEISATGYAAVENYYYGNGLGSGLQIYLSPPPPNDNFANGIVLTGTNLTGTGSNVGASQESGEPNPTGNAAGQSVWWSWTAPCNGLLSIDATASSFYPLVEVYTGSSLLSLTTAANGGGTISFLVTAGTTYQISLDGYSYYYPSSGNISFNLNFIPAPPNDNFANRITITGTSVTVSGSNIAATLEPNEPVHTENFHGIESWTGSQSVWWTWQAPKSGTVTISTSGSAFSTIIEVYTGTSISTLTEVAGSPQLFPSIPNQLSFSATSGTIYQICITSENQSNGTISLSLSEP